MPVWVPHWFQPVHAGMGYWKLALDGSRLGQPIQLLNRTIVYKSRNIPSNVFTEKRTRVHLRVYTDTLTLYWIGPPNAGILFKIQIRRVL